MGAQMPLENWDEIRTAYQVARVGTVAQRYEETIGDYAAGAVRRFANLAESEDWLPAISCVSASK